MTPTDFAQILHAWQSFYTLLGEASVTLTGLMFIAASLGTSLIDDKAGPKIQTFITPTVTYFSLVLLLSALMNVPSQTPLLLTLELGAAGVIGTGYSASHSRRLRSFDLDPGDTGHIWLWNLALPLFASLWLLGAALEMCRSFTKGLDAAAVGIVLLVLIGLHNAWSVTLRMVRLTPS